MIQCLGQCITRSSGALQNSGRQRGCVTFCEHQTIAHYSGAYDWQRMNAWRTKGRKEWRPRCCEHRMIRCSLGRSTGTSGVCQSSATEELRLGWIHTRWSGAYHGRAPDHPVLSTQLRQRRPRSFCTRRMISKTYNVYAHILCLFYKLVYQWHSYIYWTNFTFHYLT